MSITVKQLADGRRVIFDKGRFDNWCVYIVEKDGSKRAPRDVEYFTDMKNLAGQYPGDKVYRDFATLYRHTGKNIAPAVLELINRITATYDLQHRSLIEQCLSVLYAGMIAEENKQNAILKKRIKHLGVYQILKLGFRPDVAANFSKGKKWRELDAIMKSLGL